MRRGAIAFALGAWLALGTAVEAAEPIAYVTEIQRKGAAHVAVRTAGTPEWKVPQPLLALRPGDQLRATSDARIVLLFHAGGGTVTVTSANSPFTVEARPGSPRSEQVRVVTAGITEFFLGKQAPPTHRRAASRGDAVMIVSPRHTRLFPGPITFEWEGAEHLRYAVRVVGPEGPVWQQSDLPRAPLSYPSSAAPLARGVRYSWELLAPGQPSQQTMFEILTNVEAARVRTALETLDREIREYPRATATVMRAALLFEHGLFAEVRRDLERAAAANPDEAALRLMLGYVYEQIGLSAKAAQAFERAKQLTGQ
jgi:hypothetical protein